MKGKDYTKNPDKELLSLVKDLRIRLMRTYHFTEGNKAEKPENRSRLRKEIARIETELSVRRNKK